MKRLFLSMMAMAAIATTLTLTSCGSDDDGMILPTGLLFWLPTVKH